MANFININEINDNIQCYNYNDPSYAYGGETPPMSGSEGSMSPVGLTNFTTMKIDEEALPIDCPYLVITEQPVEKFRFRYKSEIVGTHGCLNGVTSTRNRKNAFPSVQLMNFGEPAVIRCSLYQCRNGGLEKGPHAHRLVQKLDKEEVDDPHDIVVNQSTGFIACFNNMGIVHTAKKFLVDELKRKKMNLKREELMRSSSPRDVTKAEEMAIINECNHESRNMEMNKVCLRFDAFIRCDDVLLPICSPVYSNEIKNLKSALTGDLKIVRMDHCTSPVAGGKEIYLLVEKVAKKNIRVRFYEEDDDVWNAYARFNENDVHHQYAIVIKTPPYKNLDIDVEKKVYVQLERPSDGAISDPLEFTYYPDRRTRRKRPRCDYDSSLSFSSSEVPTIINQVENLSGDWNKFIENVNSGEFRAILHDIDMTNVFLQTDTPSGSKLKKQVPKEVEDLKRFFSEIKSLLKTNPSQSKVKEMIEHYFNELKGPSGKNLLHIAYQYKVEIPDINNNIENLLKCLQIFKLSHYLNETTTNGETVLHMAIQNGNLLDIKHLIEYGADPCARDCDGNTALLLAVKNNYTKCLSPLLKASNVKSFIDSQNHEGYTALQLAVLSDNLEAIEQLCTAGANVRVIDNKNGRSIMQIAINEQYADVVEFFLTRNDVNYDHMDYCDKTCQELAFIQKKNDAGRWIYEILSAHLKTIDKYKYFDHEIKAEIDSDNDDLEIDYPQTELTQEQLKEMYCSVLQFTDITLDKLCAILNPTGKWKKLLDILDLNHLSNTDILNNNPTKELLDFALVAGRSVYQIRSALDDMNVPEAVKCIDDMVKR